MKRAFTLIELLVVIAIIAILAAILFPVFASAKMASKKAQSVSNMKQIVLASIMYAEDNDDRLPHTEYLEDGVWQRANYWSVHSFQAAVELYMKSGVALKNKASVWWDPADPERSTRFMWGSYLFNGFMDCTPRTLSSIASHSETIFQTLRASGWAEVVGVAPPAGDPPSNDPFWESEWFEMSYDGFDREDPSNPYFYTQGVAMPPCSLFPNMGPCYDGDDKIDKTRYAGKTIFSFVDGHVKPGKFESTWRSVEENQWDVR